MRLNFVEHLSSSKEKKMFVFYEIKKNTKKSIYRLNIHYHTCRSWIEQNRYFQQIIFSWNWIHINKSERSLTQTMQWMDWHFNCYKYQLVVECRVEDPDEVDPDPIHGKTTGSDPRKTTQNPPDKIRPFLWE